MLLAIATESMKSWEKPSSYPASLFSAICLKSPPAQKPLPAPVRTTASTSVSAAIRR